MHAGARRKIAAIIAAVGISTSAAFATPAGPVVAATPPGSRAVGSAPASVVVDNRRLSVPAGAYFYGAQFGAMSTDGTHVYINSISRLETSDHIGGVAARPFDVVAGRIIPMTELSSDSVYLLGTSRDGGTSVVETLGPTVGLSLLRDGALTVIARDAITLRFVALSDDGSTVVIRTNSQLAATDTNDTEDLYAWHRATGKVEQVNIGTSAPTFNWISSDGARIMFTAVGMVGQPYPPGTDPVIFERTAAGVSMRGRGRFISEGADGTRLYFNTVEPLVAADQDAGVDGYVNDATGDHVLTQPSTAWAPLVTVSADGSKWIFTTNEALDPHDTDTTADDYLGTTSGVALLTRGDAESIWDGTDASFSTGIYETASSLDPNDTDVDRDVYRIHLDDPADPELISAGGTGASSEVHGLAYAADGSRALLTSYYALLPEDTDPQQDAYEWVAGALHLITIGDAQAELVRAWTPDLRRIVFDSFVALTDDVTYSASENVYISDADLAAPELVLGSPGATTGPDVAVTFDTRGHDGTWFDCSLDGAEWARCASPFAVHNLADGSHDLRIRAWDAAANMDEARTFWTVDRATHPPVGPTATVSVLAARLATTTLSPRWSARAGSSPVTGYDVRYRSARWNGGFGPFAGWKTATTATSGTLTGSKGSSYCFSARAHDEDGLTSTWSAESCMAVPLDDRSLSRSASWVIGNSASYYGRTYARSATSGASLTRTGVVAKGLALVATRCSGCGTVRVYWNGALLRTIPLTSPTTVHRAILTIASFSTARTGTLVIVVVGRRPVMIDGLMVFR